MVDLKAMNRALVLLALLAAVTLVVPCSGARPPRRGLFFLLPRPWSEHAKCWQSYAGFRSCKMDIFWSHFAQRLQLSSGCCEAIKGMEEHCYHGSFSWFAFSPYSPPNLRVLCVSADQGSPPVPLTADASAAGSPPPISAPSSGPALAPSNSGAAAPDTAAAAGLPSFLGPTLAPSNNGAAAPDTGASGGLPPISPPSLVPALAPSNGAIAPAAGRPPISSASSGPALAPRNSGTQLNQIYIDAGEVTPSSDEASGSSADDAGEYDDPDP